MATTYFDHERYERAMNQRIFLLSMKDTDEKIYDTNHVVKTFHVMGTTGNVYDVLISSTPTCTCPDFIKRKSRCKHIYFILSKVMGYEIRSNERLNKQTLQFLYDNISCVVQEVFAPETCIQKYEQTTATSTSTSNDDTCKKQICIDDVCPICLCDMNSKTEILDYCKKGCGRTIHEFCFKQWCMKNEAKCVFCRCAWYKENQPTAGTTKYVNLYV